MSRYLYFRRVLLFAVVGCFGSTTSAYAYLDPGSISLVAQSVIALLVGGFTLITLKFEQLKTFLKKMFSKNQNSEETKNKNIEKK